MISTNEGVEVHGTKTIVAWSRLRPGYVQGHVQLRGRRVLRFIVERVERSRWVLWDQVEGPKRPKGGGRVLGWVKTGMLKELKARCDRRYSNEIEAHDKAKRLRKQLGKGGYEYVKALEAVVDDLLAAALRHGWAGDLSTETVWRGNKPAARR